MSTSKTVEERLYDRPVRDVDLIVRTGGDERTSNFLPWHANGNEAAVYFCAPYWPEFSEVEFLRAIRTYQSREESWRQARRSGRSRSFGRSPRWKSPRRTRWRGDSATGSRSTPTRSLPHSRDDDEDAVEDRSEDGSPPETATENAGQTPTGERDAEPESAD